MKKKTFYSFLTQYVKEMNNSHSLSLFKNELESQKNVRLKSLFGFYLLFTPKAQDVLLMKPNRFPTLQKQYYEYRDKYHGANLTNLNEYVRALDPFDELRKLFQSYDNLIHKHDLFMKMDYRNKIMILQEEKNITNYKIYTSLNFNIGNTNDFLKNNHLEKLSLEKIRKMYDFCVQR